MTINKFAANGESVFIRYHLEHADGTHLRASELFEFQGDKIRAIDTFWYVLKDDLFRG